MHSLSTDSEMATFAKTTFNVARYASVRPSYPAQVYELIFNYHAHTQAGQPGWNTVVDLGCGTGQVTRELAPKFERVIAVDPSIKMLNQAREALSSEAQKKNIEFVNASAETLLDQMPELEGQVDMITAAQAAHWFKYPNVYESLKRILRPQTGSFAFWGYSEFRFTSWHLLTRLISEYSREDDPAISLGPHWEQPGRNIVDNHFDPIEMPTEKDGFRDVKRIWYALPHHQSGEGVENHLAILKKTTNWEGLEHYLRTFSALHTYHEANPQDKLLKVEGLQGRYNPTEGDLPQRFLGRCQATLREEGIELEDEFEIEWPLSIFMARRL